MPPNIEKLLQGAALSIDYRTIFVGIFFSIVGWLAWRHGRKAQRGRHMILGVSLMAYAYFVSSFWWSLGIGAILTVFLFWP